MRGAGTKARQGKTLLDLTLSSLYGSKEGGPCHIQFRHDGQEQVVPFGGESPRSNHNAFFYLMLHVNHNTLLHLTCTIVMCHLPDMKGRHTWIIRKRSTGSSRRLTRHASRILVPRCLACITFLRVIGTSL